MIEESKSIMDPEKRAAKLREIARIKHEHAYGGVTTYQPLITFAWNKKKVSYKPWPGSYGRSLQELGLKK